MHAIMLRDEVMEDELEAVAHDWMEAQEEEIGMQSRFRAVLDPDRPVATGDPVVDEWERQFARGELPDWMRED